MKHKTLYHNGEIYTCNLRDEVARSMVVQDDQILYVGPYREACRLLDDDTAVVDLRGKAVIPGFFDSFLYLQGHSKDETENYPFPVNDFALSQKAIAFSKECAARGITSACISTDRGADTVRTVTRCALKGNLALRATFLIGDPENSVATDAFHHRLLDCGICTGLGDGFVRIGAAILSAQNEQSFKNNVSRLLESGMQLHFHTENESELEKVLFLYKNASVGEGIIKRPKITVNYPISEKIAERIVSLGMIVVTSPMHWHVFSSNASPLPLQMLLEKSALAIASFAKEAEQANSMKAVQMLLEAERGLSISQALRACTFGGAFASFAESKVGSIEWGKSADFCLLSSSLQAIPRERMDSVFVEKTFIGGKPVYERTTFSLSEERSKVARFPTPFSK